MKTKILLFIAAMLSVVCRGDDIDPAVESACTVSDELEYYQSPDIFAERPGVGFIVISKTEMKLRLYDWRDTLLLEYPIACGKGLGDKQVEGDMKTPEGIFDVQQIQDVSKWTHDFNDGNGEISGAYGSLFMRLSTPGHRGIGIHGTHDPSSIGQRVTEGCIRLNNENLISLANVVCLYMTVIITP